MYGTKKGSTTGDDRDVIDGEGGEMEDNGQGKRWKKWHVGINWRTATPPREGGSSKGDESILVGMGPPQHTWHAET